MKRTTGFELLPSPANERRGGGLSALPAAALLSAGVMWLLGAPYWAPLSALFCVGAALLGRFRWTTAAALALVAAFCAVLCSMKSILLKLILPSIRSWATR